MPTDPAKSNAAESPEPAIDQEDVPIISNVDTGDPGPVPRRERVVVGCSLLAIALLYLVLARASWRTNAIWSPDCGARAAMIRNWIDHGSLVYLTYANADVDPKGDLHPLGLLDGNHLWNGYVVHLPKGFCTQYPPLFPFLSGIGYRIFGFPGLYVLPYLGGMGLLFVTYLLARRMGLRSRVLVLISMGIATPALIYSVVFWDHSLQMLIAALCGYLLLLSLQTGRITYAVGAGISLGVGVFFHELFGLLFGCLLIAAIPWIRGESMRRAVKGMTLGFAPLLVIWVATNFWIYGTPLSAHFTVARNSAHSAGFAKMLSGGDILRRAMMELVGYDAGWGTSFIAVAAVIALIYVALLCVGGKLLRFAPFVCLLFAPLTLAWLTRKDVSFALGLFQATPLLIPAIAFPCLGRKGCIGETDPPVVTTFARWIGAAYLLFSIGVIANPQDPGLNIGSRYLLTGLPWLIVLAARVLEGNYFAVRSPWRAAAALSAALLVGVSVFSEVKGYRAVMYMKRGIQAEHGDVARSHNPILVYSDWDAGAHDSERPGRRVFCVRDANDNGAELYDALERLHADSFAYHGRGPTFVGLARLGLRQNPPYVATGVEPNTRSMTTVHFERMPNGIDMNRIAPRYRRFLTKLLSEPR